MHTLTSLNASEQVAFSADSRSQAGPLPLPSRRISLLFLGVFAVAFAIYVSIWPSAPVMAPDSQTYMVLARDMSHGELSHLHLRTPGYPLFLLWTRSAVTPTRLLFYASLALHFASISCLAYLLYFLRIRGWAIAILTGIALLPPYVEPAAYVLTETLTTFLVSLMFSSLIIWLCGRNRSMLVVFSLAAVSAAFVRPTYEMLVPALILTVCLVVLLGWVPGMTLRRVCIGMGVALTLVVVSLGAYSFLNYERFHYFATSAMSPLTLATRTVTVVEFLPPEYDGVRKILLKYRDPLLLAPGEDHMALGYIHGAMPEIVQFYGGDEIKALRAVQKMNVGLILAKPMSYLIETLKLLGPYWMPNDCVLANGGSAIRRALWAALQLGVMGAFFLQEVVLAGAAIFYLSFRLFRGSADRISWRRAGRLACAWLVGSGIVMYTAVLSCAASTGTPRYRVPTDLLIVFLSLIGFALWGRAIERLAVTPTAGSVGS